ncbi:hypothetical protein CPB83DRAFT_450075 [Crepidotus variabilis]|uniref:F-box domain-containing protein n=1 Tax=Crepidotus variabilis TaxID=179855 RepID=A0A9P6JNL3_9AGAR|nr:hypothetical protein CPB83DRAFT_450075 [Crepidotus variabilis]
MATIHHLPVEILSIIFELLYPEVLEEKDVKVSIPQQEIITENLASPVETLRFIDNGQLTTDFPDIFPYQVARVCTHWLEILKRVPKYWTLVVFDVCLDPTPFLDMFKWSPGHFISVFIFNSESSRFTEGHPQLVQDDFAPQRRSTEHACVSRVTEALRPYVWRCLAVSYKLLYSSNLPPLPLVLQNHNSDFNQLEYKGLVDTPSFDWTPQRSISMPIVMDNLVDLTLDVAVFMAMNQMQPDGWASFECSQECRITFDRYAFTQTGGSSQKSKNPKRHTIQQFLDALDTITESINVLGFRSLSIDSSSPTSATENQESTVSENGWFSCSHLLFIDNSPDFVARILPSMVQRQSFFDSVLFVSCNLPSLDSRLPSLLRSTCLYFDNLSTDARLENILGVWDGSDLDIDNCPSFGPAVLQFLSEERPEKSWPCPSMDSLTISDCEIEEYAHFNNLIASRQAAFPTTGIRELAILGSTMIISEDEYDQLWTAELLDVFKYEGCIVLN